jgi:cytochrome c556
MNVSFKSLVIAIVAVGFLGAISAPVTYAASTDSVKVRKALMKEMSVHNKSIKKFIKGHKNPKKAKRLGDAADMELRAMALGGLATRMLTLFPKGTSLNDQKGTRAKPEIWSKWSDFEASAKKFGGLAAKLEQASATGDKAKMKAALGALGKQGCGGCHKAFRGPKPKKKSS